MKTPVILLSIPGLRAQDLAHMPRLRAIAEEGKQVPLVPSFPCVTCSVQANLTTGVGPEQHGVIANGFFYRDKGQFEMWTAWNEAIQVPQIWDILHQHDPRIKTAVWFPMLAKGCGATFICTPAPIHNPDGSESLWCYTKPKEFYGDLRDKFGHFPLMNFWGPIANINSTNWIASSLLECLRLHKPDFSYAYLPHLDYAAQKFGPNSPQAAKSLEELDAVIGQIHDGSSKIFGNWPLFLIASEYVITDVDAVSYPNRILRDAGFISITNQDAGGEILDVANSRAWAMVDHQIAHVFIKNSADIPLVKAALEKDPLIESIYAGEDRHQIGLNHPRSGELVLISKPNAWFAYYYWQDDNLAPSFARSVDIHQKPGYDPVELFIKMPEKQIPLDANLVKGSHGYPATSPSRHGVLITSDSTTIDQTPSLKDTEMIKLIIKHFGVEN
jgi:predicted AlkP superfamily pyrophosphatase or phosphodiesterase